MMVGENRVTPLALKEITVDEMKKFPISVRTSAVHAIALINTVGCTMCTWCMYPVLWKPMSQTVCVAMVCTKCTYFNISILYVCIPCSTRAVCMPEV